MASKVGKQRPEVDDVDVQHVADMFLSGTDPNKSEEFIGDCAREFAMWFGVALGTSNAWRREFARKVQARVQFGLMARRRQSRTS